MFYVRFVKIVEVLIMTLMMWSFEACDKHNEPVIVATEAEEATVISTIENKNAILYTTSDGWEIYQSKRDGSWGINEYTGQEKNPTIPVTFRGNKLTAIGIEGNSYVETVVVPDQFSWVGFSNCSNLRELTIGKGVMELRPCMINYCYGLKVINVKGPVSIVKAGFVDGGALQESYFQGETINFFQNPQTIYNFKDKAESEYLTTINNLTHGANDFKEINFYY